MANETCPICNSDSLVNKLSPLPDNISYYWGECKRCGVYCIHRGLIDANKPEGYWDVNHLISAWITRENKQKKCPYIPEKGIAFDDPSWLQRFKHMGFPMTVDEKLDKLLLFYAESRGYSYTTYFNPFDAPILLTTLQEIALKDMSELCSLHTLLNDLDYMEELETSDITGSSSRLTAKGWQHIGELRKSNISSSSAFIAMWFDTSTEEYRKAVTTAVEHCGYKPIIVDREEFTGFIMEKIVSFIRKARFMVADFTTRPEQERDSGKPTCGVRGGVYWEAGMAFGLGIPVIHTCEDSPEARSRIHFDVDQYNTIFWNQKDLSLDIRQPDEIKDNPNFTEKLVSRILYLVGEGSYRAE